MYLNFTKNLHHGFFNVGLLCTRESKGTLRCSGRNWRIEAQDLCVGGVSSQEQKWRHLNPSIRTNNSVVNFLPPSDTFHFVVIYLLRYFSLKAILQLLGIYRATARHEQGTWGWTRWRKTEGRETRQWWNGKEDISSKVKEEWNVWKWQIWRP